MSNNNIAASVRSRLKNLAQERKQNFDFALTRFCLERLLYRVSISQYADQFLLKGAMLFDLWFDIPHRPTRDIDFLGFGSSELSDIEATFREISAIEVPDGVEFQPDTVKATEIRNEANYPGVRVALRAVLAGARISIQVDIGFGDVVTPGPEDAAYPVMLATFEAPRLRVYPHYSVVAEKLEALTMLGIANSRMKDYFDLRIIALRTEFEGDLLKQSVKATFHCRQTELPDENPFGLTAAFARDKQKQSQWKAFLNKNGLEILPLDEVTDFLAGFLMPVINAAREDQPFNVHWPAGGPWSSSS